MMVQKKKKFAWSWYNMFPCTSFSNARRRHETNNKHLPEQQEPEGGGAEPAPCCPSPQRLSLMDIISNPGSDQISMEDISSSLVGSNLYGFSLDEIRSITKNFTSGNLGEGGFGAVYKGFISDKVRPGLEAQVVAVKVLDLEGSQGHKEWLAEVIFLGQLRHPNLVKLTGYCCEDDQRMLVYEYMERGNLDEKLFRRFSAPLPWLTRMKIALEAAKGLAFLHGEKKPVIFRDFKAANILLAYDFTAKLSDFGFARDGPEEDKTHVTTKHRLGTRGYAAPEYIMTGHLTTMSDVYSFGVVLLELLTGRRSIDKTRPRREQNLVEWARPQLKDPRKVDQLMDPRLEGQYSGQGVRIAAALAYQCLSRHPKSRPPMSVAVKTLEPVINMKDDILPGPFVYVVPTTAADGSRIIDASSEKKGKDLNNETVMVEGRKEEAADRKKEDGGRKKKKKKKSTRRKSGHDHVSRNRAVFSDSALDIRLR